MRLPLFWLATAQPMRCLLSTLAPLFHIWPHPPNRSWTRTLPRCLLITQRWALIGHGCTHGHIRRLGGVSPPRGIFASCELTRRPGAEQEHSAPAQTRLLQWSRSRPRPRHNPRRGDLYPSLCAGSGREEQSPSAAARLQFYR